MTRKVLIGTPFREGVSAWYTDSLFHSGLLCREHDIDLAPLLIWDRLSNLANARNELVARAVLGDYDDLIFIDSDQEWKPEWIVRLLSHPVDVVGAPVRIKRDDLERYNVRAPGGPESFVHNPECGLWTAPGMTLGTGLLRLSKDALQALWDTSEPYRVMDSKVPLRAVFEYLPVNGELVGEDVRVCMKLHALGCDVWLDPTMNPGHIGSKMWTGDFATWLGRAQTETRTALVKAV